MAGVTVLPMTAGQQGLHTDIRKVLPGVLRFRMRRPVEGDTLCLPILRQN
jgi:hypothetical protein